MSETKKSAAKVKTLITKKTAAAKKTPAKKVGAKKVTAKKAATKSSPSASVAPEKKPKKQKVIRDSFTMPKLEYEQIAQLKLHCINAGIAAKKSELLRAGLLVLGRLNTAELVRAISALDTVKTGRPLSSVGDESSKISKKRKKTK